MAWLTVDAVRTYAGVPAAEPVDAAALAMAVDAVEVVVARVRPEHADPDTGVYTPPADVLLGAAMLAWRWYSRRGSPLGVAGYAELGTAGILRHDPDIARLLRLGAAGPFVFGATGPPPQDWHPWVS